jgi:DUF1707 SHOCT-like domain
MVDVTDPVAARLPGQQRSATHVTSPAAVNLAMLLACRRGVPVAAGPGNWGPAEAAGRGYLRASDADREHVIDVLKAAFVQGRLTKAELDARVGQAFAARTYADLAALTADVPAGLMDAVPTGRVARAHARRPMGNAAKAGICAVIAVAVAVIVSIPTGGMALFIFAPFYFMGLVVAGAQILASRYEKRSRSGQLPPRPAQGGQALEGKPGSTPDDDLTLCQASRWAARARHLPGYSVTQRIWRSVPARRASAGLCT